MGDVCPLNEALRIVSHKRQNIFRDVTRREQP